MEFETLPTVETTTFTTTTTEKIITAPVVDPVEGDMSLILNDSIGSLNLTAVEYVPVVAAVTVFGILLFVGALAILLFVVTLVFGRRKIAEYPFFVIVWHATLANAAYVSMCISSILPSMLFENADPDNLFYKWASRIMESADQGLLYLTLLMTINRFFVFCVPQFGHIFNRLSLTVMCFIVWAYVAFIVTWNVNFGLIRKFDRKKLTMSETLLGSNPLTRFFTLSSTVLPIVMLFMYAAIVTVIINRRRMRRDTKVSRQDVMLLWQALVVTLALEISKLTSVLTPLIAATTWLAWVWTIFSYSMSIVNQIINPLLFLVMNQMIRGVMMRMLALDGKKNESVSERVIVNLSMSSSEKKKLLHLQGLRGLAILSVVFFHFLPSFFPNGFIGVDIFFVLSGFLMTMMLRKSTSLGTKEIVEFLYRRVKRIAPLYYLFSLFTMVLLFYLPLSFRKFNVDSAFSGLLFISNLMTPTGFEEYAKKLGQAMDLFTHTWSLAVEMQFYLIFPFILYFPFSSSNRLSVHYLRCITLISYIFHFFSNEYNSTLARIWQFIAGTLVFIDRNSSCSNEFENQEENEEVPLMSFEEENVENEEQRPQDTYSTVQWIGFAILMTISFSSQKIPTLFLRTITILCTMLLVRFGDGSLLLENSPLVFLGEISFVWYLFHWPIAAALLRFRNLSSSEYVFLGIHSSFLISVVVHYFWERRYLTWVKTTVIPTVILLLIANGTVLYILQNSVPSVENSRKFEVLQKFSPTFNSSFNYPSDFIANFVWGYENLTTNERANLNEKNQATDMERHALKGFCTKFKTSKNPMEKRCEFNEHSNKNANLKLLVIGNSWASNLMPVIVSECKEKFNHMEIAYAGVCESLARSDVSGDYNCGLDWMFREAVKKIRPDVLFVVERHIQFMEIRGGTNPFDDENFRIAVERLTSMEKHVSKRIFLLDAFPEIIGEWDGGDLIDNVNDLLFPPNQTKEEIVSDDFLVAINQKYMTAKVRLQRLVENCPKCRLFDYVPQFFIDGQFKLYDPKYFVSFFTNGQHLTPFGWERVRPLIRNICDTL